MLATFRKGSLMEWREIPGWEAYEVSEDGQVRRDGLLRKPWRIQDRWDELLRGVPGSAPLLTAGREV